MTNLAYHNDAALRERVLEQIAEHQAADEIAQGCYYKQDDYGVHACFIGCVAHGSDVTVFEEMTGFPAMLTKIGESIFEGLPFAEAKDFPLRVASAPKLGVDLSTVAWKFLAWLVETTLERHGTDEVRANCAEALAVAHDKAAGIAVTSERAAYAADAANAAIYAAADVAIAASDAAIYAAADSARAASYIAASDAIIYVAADAAADAHREQATKLIELLSAA